MPEDSHEALCQKLSRSPAAPCPAGPYLSMQLQYHGLSAVTASHTNSQYALGVQMIVDIRDNYVLHHF